MLKFVNLWARDHDIGLRKWRKRTEIVLSRSTSPLSRNVIFHRHHLLNCVVFLEDQCFVNHEDFQHWNIKLAIPLSPPPPPPCPHMRVAQAGWGGGRKLELSVYSEAIVQRCCIRMAALEILGNFQEINCDEVLFQWNCTVKPCNFIHHGYFPRNSRNFQKSYSVTCEQLLL